MLEEQGPETATGNARAKEKKRLRMEILPIGKELDDADKENLEEQGPETATGNARAKEKKGFGWKFFLSAKN